MLLVLNEGVDYDGFCQRILSVVNSPDPIMTYGNSGAGGGLGHKYYSMVESLIYALLLHRTYRSAALSAC